MGRRTLSHCSRHDAGDSRDSSVGFESSKRAVSRRSVRLEGAIGEYSVVRLRVSARTDVGSTHRRTGRGLRRARVDSGDLVSREVPAVCLPAAVRRVWDELRGLGPVLGPPFRDSCSSTRPCSFRRACSQIGSARSSSSRPGCSSVPFLRPPVSGPRSGCSRWRSSVPRNWAVCSGSSTGTPIVATDGHCNSSHSVSRSPSERGIYHSKS